MNNNNESLYLQWCQRFPSVDFDQVKKIVLKFQKEEEKDPQSMKQKIEQSLDKIVRKQTARKFSLIAASAAAEEAEYHSSNSASSLTAAAERNHTSVWADASPKQRQRFISHYLSEYEGQLCQEQIVAVLEHTFDLQAAEKEFDKIASLSPENEEFVATLTERPTRFIHLGNNNNNSKQKKEEREKQQQQQSSSFSSSIRNNNHTQNNNNRFVPERQAAAMSEIEFFKQSFPRLTTIQVESVLSEFADTETRLEMLEQAHSQMANESFLASLSSSSSSSSSNKKAVANDDEEEEAAALRLVKTNARADELLQRFCSLDKNTVLAVLARSSPEFVESNLARLNDQRLKKMQVEQEQEVEKKKKQNKKKNQKNANEEEGEEGEHNSDHTVSDYSDNDTSSNSSFENIDELCCVCLDAPRTHQVIHADPSLRHHAVLCKDCALKLESSANRRVCVLCQCSFVAILPVTSVVPDRLSSSSATTASATCGENENEAEEEGEGGERKKKKKKLSKKNKKHQHSR